MTLAFCLGAEVAAKRYRQAAAYIDRCASAVPGAPGFCLLWSRTEVRQAIHHKPATVREPAPAVAQGNSTPYPPVDSRLRGNDGTGPGGVIPACAGIHENRGGRGFPYKAPVRDPSRLAQRTNLSRFNPPAAPQRHGWLRNPTLLHLSDVDGPQPCARVRSTRRHGIPPDATLRPKSHQQG